GLAPDEDGVAVLVYGLAVGNHALSHPGDERDRGMRRRGEVPDPLADPAAVDEHLDQADLAGRVAPDRLAALGQEPAQYLADRPANGGHRRDAQPLVDGGAALVVDARDDVVDRVAVAHDAGG